MTAFALRPSTRSESESNGASLKPIGWRCCCCWWLICTHWGACCFWNWSPPKSGKQQSPKSVTQTGTHRKLSRRRSTCDRITFHQASHLAPSPGFSTLYNYNWYYVYLDQRGKGKRKRSVMRTGEANQKSYCQINRIVWGSVGGSRPNTFSQTFSTNY